MGALVIFLCLSGGKAQAADKATTGQVCKAAIAFMMGRDPAIIRVDKFANGVAQLHYVRPDDNSTWRYKCKLEGSKVIWGTQNGRWRTHPDDEVITFKLNEGAITVRETYADGSHNEESFPRSSL